MFIPGIVPFYLPIALTPSLYPHGTLIKMSDLMTCSFHNVLHFHPYLTSIGLLFVLNLL